MGVSLPVMGVPGVLGGGGGGVAYLSRFTFDSDGTLGATYTEGKGTLTVSDPANVLSKSSSALVVSGTPSGITLIHEDFDRVAGRAFRVDVPTRTTCNSQRIGIGPQEAYSLRPGVWLDSNETSMSIVDGETAIYAHTPGAGTWQILTIAHAAGGLLLARVSTAANYTLLWRANAVATGIRTKLYCFPGQAVNLTLDNWQVRDLGSAYADWMQVTDYKANPTSGDTLTTPADQFLEFTWTPVALETLTLLFRRADDDNCLKLVCDQVGGTIKLYERVAASDAEIAAGKTQTWTAGTAYRIVMITDGTTIKTFVGNVAKHATTSSVQLTATTAKVSGFTDAKGIDFAAWPRSLPVPFESAVSAAPRLLFPFGDSYTYGTGDDTPPPVGKNGYPAILLAALNGSTGIAWAELSRVGVGGATVAVLKAEVDADLTARPGVLPYAILIDMGQNDLASMPTKASWVANAGYILDAIHAKWPSARIGIARIYSAGYPDETATINTDWIPTVLSTRSWAELGIDRSALLTTVGDLDGTEHPTRQGYTKMAAAWQTILTG